MVKKEYTVEERQAWLKSLPGIPASAAMMLEDPDGKLLIVKANYRNHWTLPGGVIDKRESPKQAAIREVGEEVGLAIPPEAVKFISAIFRTSDVTDTYQFIFKSVISHEWAEKITMQESEIEEYIFVTKEDIRKSFYLCSPIITDWANDSIAGYSEQTVDLLAE